MTSDEFNEKYKEFLEDGFDGMEITHAEIIQLCDEYFQNWIKIPGFKYCQIKVKFGTSRVYCDCDSSHRDELNTIELETLIDEILKEMNYG